MVNKQTTWDKIMKTFSPGRIRDLNRTEEIDTDKRDFLDIVTEIDGVTRDGSGVVLPQDFFIELNARTLRKYLQPLKWRRVKSKRQARKERITPYMLMQEARQKMRIEKYYGGTGWRGLSDRRNKNFLLYSWIEGWELFNIAGHLIKIRRYDRPEELQEVTEEERARISREISKLTKRRINLEQEIMRRGGVRVGRVPSRTSRGGFYDDMKIEGLPVTFRGSSSDFCYSTWFDITSRHSCKDKQMFIAYMRPREEIFCAHDVAFLSACYTNDYIYHSNPFLVFTPFPKPNPELVDANRRYRKQVFKRVGAKRVPISKIDREGLLFCEIKSTNAKFF